nr:u4/u6.u5 small nuclear ribonucleoprotein 27 kda protein [Quercus suber]
MDRKDDHRSRTQRVRSGKTPDDEDHLAADTDPPQDRSRSPPSTPPAGEHRTSNHEGRRERSPIRPSPRHQLLPSSRPIGPSPTTASRARDNTTSARRGVNPPTQPKGADPPAREPVSTGPAMELLEGEDEAAQMSRIMGFADFRSTKNTKVPGNDKNYGVSKVKKTEYRQYMNRVGGFNRPLDST